MVDGMKEGDFVIAKGGGIRYVTRDNGDGMTFTDDGMVSGQDGSGSCYYKYYRVLDRREVLSERFRLMRLMVSGEVLPYYFELTFVGWLRLLG